MKSEISQEFEMKVYELMEYGLEHSATVQILEVIRGQLENDHELINDGNAEGDAKAALEATQHLAKAIKAISKVYGLEK